ncbi:MAG TPA: hypothetical protein VGT61_16450 [Thermomicrobiales bacterium]|jgi:uncharacterized RDD family membrane protein YckC|nr:hypothetical protein [Thermomicrobiales bacterium]
MEIAFDAQNILAVLVFLIPFILFGAMGIASCRNHRRARAGDPSAGTWPVTTGRGKRDSANS